ncbi:MAG: helix-turn-helix domain-containing protein [Desulfobacterota bacterium]|nr:helix-turn-helix domain-containing protein [Thermodesulfobacteriota bacterium]
MRSLPPSPKLRISGETDRQLKRFVQTTRIPLRLYGRDGHLYWRSRYFQSPSNFCASIRPGQTQRRICRKVQREALREALRWGEPILSKCCYVVMQMVCPILHRGRVVGSLVASPFLLIPPSELEPEELQAIHGGPSLNLRRLRSSLRGLPVLKDEEVKGVSQLLFGMADQLSDPDLGDLLKVREAQNLQGKIADQIQDLKDFDRELTPGFLSRRFYEREREIVTRIRLGDKAGAKEILYQLLAIVLIQYLENFELLKVSTLELLIILSRAAVEAGAKTEEMLGLRYGFVTELSRIRNQEELCLWIVKVLDKITDRIYQTRNARNYQRLKKAMQFIETHCNEPLTVERVAKEVFLSASRLSHIVKEELGMTLIDYLSKVRIEKAKSLLFNEELPIARIAQEVGFSDQSYFTKVFKKIVGCTPRAFRLGLQQGPFFPKSSPSAGS